MRSSSSYKNTNIENHIACIRPEDSPPASLFHSEKKSFFRLCNDQDAYTLPPWSVVQSLVKTFFRHFGTLNPFLNEQSFLDDTAKAIYASQCRPKASSLALLNMVLAIVCVNGNVSIFPQQQLARLSEKFYCRARTLYSKFVLPRVNLELGKNLITAAILAYLTNVPVQTMLLMTQYLQCTASCAHSWVTHGLAIHSAIQIGLHVPGFADSCGPEERQSRARTWQACVVVDRQVP